jgi:hypothetical protein
MTDMALKELHLSQEIKQTQDQVEELYRQMNRKSRMGEVPEPAQSDNHDQ